MAASMNKNGVLAGKVAVITGASRGIGEAIAYRYAQEGAKVVVSARTVDEGDHMLPGSINGVVKRIRDAGGEAAANHDSVSSYDGGFNMVKTAIDSFGRLDVVICNAGILRDTAFHNMSEDDWDKVFAVHIKGSFTVLRAAWPVFRQQAYGRVVLTTSSSGIYGQFGQANYGSAKTAMLGLMNVLKQEGATEVWAMATHGVLSDPAVERLKNSVIEKVVITNTLPLPSEKQLDKIEVLSIAPLVASPAVSSTTRTSTPVTDSSRANCSRRSVSTWNDSERWSRAGTSWAWWVG